MYHIMYPGLYQDSNKKGTMYHIMYPGLYQDSNKKRYNVPHHVSGSVFTISKRYNVNLNTLETPWAEARGELTMWNRNMTMGLSSMVMHCFMVMCTTSYTVVYPAIRCGTPG